jgi:hypothetical protein
MKIEELKKSQMLTHCLIDGIRRQSNLVYYCVVTLPWTQMFSFAVRHLAAMDCVSANAQIAFDQKHWISLTTGQSRADARWKAVQTVGFMPRLAVA